MQDNGLTCVCLEICHQQIDQYHFVNEFVERPHLCMQIDQAPLTINKHYKTNIK